MSDNKIFGVKAKTLQDESNGGKAARSVFNKLLMGSIGMAEAALGALALTGENNRHEAAYGVMGIASGGLQVLASLFAANAKTETVELSNDLVLFAALLTAQCNHVLSSRKESDEVTAIGIKTEYSKENFLKAMDAFEKVTGRKADTILDPDTVKGIQNSPDDKPWDRTLTADTKPDDLANVNCANVKPA